VKRALIMLSFVATTAAAQMRTEGPQRAIQPNQQLAGQLQDPRLLQIQRELADLQRKVSDLSKQNDQLRYCVGGLKHELDALKNSKPKSDDGVTVAPPQGLGPVGCD
jgi:hypothetical protein